MNERADRAAQALAADTTARLAVTLRLADK